MRRALLLILTCVGCHASVSDGDPAGAPDSATPVDAAVDVDAPATVGPDAAPQCMNGRVVYLNFTGVTLTDAATSDATLNRASWIINGTANPAAPATNRSAAQVTAIVDGVRNALSTFPVTVVTTRPTSGQYVMIVYGGTATNVGSRFGVAVQELDCGDAATRNDVAWISDSVTATQRVINTSLGAIGFGLGLTATSSPTDCMCGWDNACVSDNSVQCTLSPSIARDPAANQKCAGLTTQDEVQTFQTAFCQ